MRAHPSGSALMSIATCITACKLVGYKMSQLPFGFDVVCDKSFNSGWWTLVIGSQLPFGFVVDCDLSITGTRFISDPLSHNSLSASLLFATVP